MSSKITITVVAYLIALWALLVSATVIGAAVWSNWGNLTPGIWLTIVLNSLFPLWGVYAGVVAAVVLLYCLATCRAGKFQ